MKDKYLGLVRPTQANRFDDNYKERLIFEWDKSEDTSGGVLNKYGQDQLKKFERKFLAKNDIQLGKTWK